MRENLTEREREIAEFISWGASHKEIALILSIPIETVKEHVKHIKKKTWD